MNIWGTEITLFDSLAFSLLFLVVLYLVGFGFILLISKLSKRLDFLSGLDVIQKFTFRVFFGFAFAFLFLLVFSLTGFSFGVIALLVVAITAVVPLVLYAWSLRGRVGFGWFRRVGAARWLLGLIVLVSILLTLYFSSSLAVGLFGSTNDDGGFHTSIIRVTLDNPSSLLTRSVAPYGEFINIYPSLAHAVSAFFVSIFDVPIQWIVVLVSVVLPCLIALAVYSTLKSLFGSRVLSVFGLVISALFAMAFTWGPLSWAGLPLMLSFFVSICGMGLVYVFFEKQEKTWLDALLIGFTFFVAVNTYPVALLLVFLWFVLLFVVKNVGRLRHVGDLSGRLFGGLVNRRNTFLFVALLVPVLFSVPYLYVAVTHSTSYLQNFPSDVQYNELVSGTNFLNDLVRSYISFNWVMDLPALAGFFSTFDPFFAVASVGIVVLAGLYVARIFKFDLLPRRFLFSLLLIYLFLLLTLAVLAFMVFVPVSFLSLFNTERIWEHLFIPSLLLTSVVLFVGGYAFYVFVRHLAKGVGALSVRRCWLTRMLVGVLLFVVIFNVGIASVPFVYSSEGNYNSFKGYLSEYNSLASDDVALMNWMKSNIPSDSRILVSAGDSGQYVEAVTQLHTMYSYDMRVFSQRYLDLMRLMTSSSFDSRAIDLLLSFNISYIYVGSIPTTYSLDYSFRDHFNATKLLTLPCFSLVHRVGDAWLLRFNSSVDPSAFKNYYASDMAYFWDDRYPVSHVLYGESISEYLGDSDFTWLNADQLQIWLNYHLSKNSSAGSSLVMTMGEAPDTVADLSGSSLLRQYLDAGGRIVWLGDVPFYYQGHADRSKTAWERNGASTILGVNFLYWEFNASASMVTSEGSRWGLSLNDTSTCQRVVLPSDVSVVFSESAGYAASWLKNYNSAFPNSGFVRYSYQDFNGTDTSRINEVIGLATYPLV